MSVYINMEMPTVPVLFCIHPDGKVFADLEGGWREYKAIYTNAKMVTKSIKKNPNQKTRRNMTYDNMKEYINTLAEEEVKKTVLAEFETVKKRSKIQKSPYQYVLSWFEAEFEGYDDLEQFMNRKEAERKQKEDAEKASSPTAENV